MLVPSADLAYETFITKCAWLNEPRCTEMINLCGECFLIPTIDSSIHHDEDTLFTICLLPKFSFIRLCVYFTINYEGAYVPY